MRKYTKTSLTVTAVAVIVFCAISAIFVTIQGIMSIISPEEFGIAWLEDFKWLQILLLIGRMAGGLAFFGLITAFIVKSIKALDSGTLFPSINVPILYSSSIALFIYNFCCTNMHIIIDADKRVAVDSDDITISLIIVLFAIIYRFAVKVSEENRLTI